MRPKLVAVRLLALTAIAFAAASCSPKADPPQWRVTEHNGTEWVFSRRAAEKTPARRIVAECTSYHWQGHDQVIGGEACSLVVGSGLVGPLESLHQSARAGVVKFPVIDVMDANTIAVTEGDGADRVVQLFKIKRDELQP